MKILQVFFFVFTSAFVFSSCGSSGDDAKVSEEQEVAEKSETAVTYTVDNATSKIIWEGTKSTGTTHNGTIDFKSGEFQVENNKITSGNFVLDMTSLEVTDEDLEEDSKSKLRAHLKGTVDGKRDDFFNVTKYPTATYKITKVTNLEGNDDANKMIYGNLTIKDTTHNVAFKAQVDINDDKLKATTSQFTIDRTKWNIMFMAKSIMDNIKDGFINNEIGVTLQITANKK